MRKQSIDGVQCPRCGTVTHAYWSEGFQRYMMSFHDDKNKVKCPQSGQPSPIPRSLADLAAEAIQIQDGSNLSGLVHGFERALSELRCHLPDLSTAEINKHPIICMWVEKLYDLTQQGCSQEKFGQVYAECRRLAGQS